MKQIEVLKLSDTAWVAKRKGFRIRCDQYLEGERTQVLMPSASEAPMDSDVAAWRVAYKLGANEQIADDGKPLYVNVTVVDDQGEPIEYFVTGQTHTFREL